MSQIPLTRDQLYKRIEQAFHSNTLCTHLIDYFEFHQFDDWKDIIDDINNGYDNCCCKIILFQQLNITNIEQRHNEYLRLQQCIELQKTPKNKIFDKIFKDINESFTKAFNPQAAQNILYLFNEILENEAFDEQETAQDDVDDIENSAIIAHVTNQLNYNQFDKNTDTIKDIISDGIKYIVEDKTDQFLTKYDLKSKGIPNPNKSTPLKPPIHTEQPEGQSKPNIMSIESVTKQIGECFRTKLGTEMGGKIKQLFEYEINEEQFEDLESVQDDMENIEESAILQYIVDQIGNALNTSDKEMIKIRIQHIVMPSKGQDEEKKEMSPSPPPKPITLLEKVRKRIEAMLHWEYFELKNKVLDAYDSILASLNYNFEQLLEDVSDPDTSSLLQAVGNIRVDDGAGMHRIVDDIKRKIKKIIETAKIQKPYFNITLFNFNVTKKDVEHTAAFVTEHCNLIYHHVMGVAKSLTDAYLLNGNSKRQEKRSTIESRALCIGKSIDSKNLKPIMNWLLHLYSKERTQKHLNGDLEPSTAYTSNDWFLENKYAKWIMRTHPIIGESIRGGLAELIKRALIPMHFNHILFPVICDRLNDFAEYALAFHRVALHLKRLMEVAEFNAAPIQIDYWIIPEMTRSQTDAGTTSRAPFDMTELKTNAGDNALDVEFIQEITYHKLCQHGDGDDCVWDIEEILKSKCYGYIENEDYFVMDQAAVDRESTLNRGLAHMIKKYHTWNSTKQRRNRYVFIIDRRHPDNIAQKNIKIEPELKKTKSSKHVKIYMIAPKQYRTEGRFTDKKTELCICGQPLKKIKRSKVQLKDTECHWCGNSDTDFVCICPKKHDKGYILCSEECGKARPDTHCKITKEWEAVPEQCLSLSKNFILMHPDKDKKRIRMDDACNGYMFGLSYHILREDNICTYFYHNGGGTVFDIGDIKNGWSQWFDTIDGKPQVLNETIKDELKRIQNNDDLKLPNLGFQEFERQCNDDKSF